MSDTSDMDLIREYAETSSESAFAELVRRYINLVYSVALRFTGNSLDAEDVAQAVFIILAKKAAGLRAGTVLTGWLYETTRLTAVQFLRTRARRHHYEKEAYVQSTLDHPNADPLWPQLRPLLEQAMSRLNEKERTLVALRFFENRSSVESAVILGIGEWTARKRAARALEKLRRYLSNHGVSSTTAVIERAISANSLQAAPAALAKTVASVAIAKGATASASTLTLIKGALKLMAWTKAKTTIVAGAAALVLAAGTATIAVQRHIKAEQFAPAAAPWSDAGASTPRAVLQSLAWALTQGKTDRAEQLMQWDEKGIENNSRRSFEHQFIQMSVLAPALKDIRSFKITSVRQVTGTDELIVSIEKTFQNNVREFQVTVKLRRVNGQWRAVGDVEYFPNGSTSMRLPFMGSF